MNPRKVSTFLLKEKEKKMLLVLIFFQAAYERTVLIDQLIWKQTQFLWSPIFRWWNLILKWPLLKKLRTSLCEWFLRATWGWRESMHWVLVIWIWVYRC